jgi:hypothetical protein
MPEYGYLYLNDNPRGPCVECRPDVGLVFAEHERPAVPRHEGCYCYYERVPADSPEMPVRDLGPVGDLAVVGPGAPARESVPGDPRRVEWRLE